VPISIFAVLLLFFLLFPKLGFAELALARARVRGHKLVEENRLSRSKPLDERYRDVTRVTMPRRRLEINLVLMGSLRAGSPRMALRSAFPLPARYVLALCLAVCGLAYGQFAYPEQEIHVRDLPSLTARSHHASDVLTTSLETIFNNRDVCCGKNSALEDSVQSSDPKSLKDIASKLQGRHLLSDGRSVTVAAEYLLPDAVNSGQLIGSILNQHPPLMEWNSHLYVVSGVTYVETVDYSSAVNTKAIHKFLLQDERFSDSRRAVAFDRTTDDWSKVQGFLFLQATLE